ncbi:hypothetical protein B0H13DRAFT_2332279 [Mycena leptocephala]|nr:hypothetical protein B0H13DRAFT_2332279 [Mycena leptocephala]
MVHSPGIELFLERGALGFNGMGTPAVFVGFTAVTTASIIRRKEEASAQSARAKADEKVRFLFVSSFSPSSPLPPPSPPSSERINADWMYRFSVYFLFIQLARIIACRSARHSALEIDMVFLFFAYSRSSLHAPGLCHQSAPEREKDAWKERQAAEKEAHTALAKPNAHGAGRGRREQPQAGEAAEAALPPTLLVDWEFYLGREESGRRWGEVITTHTLTILTFLQLLLASTF